MKTLIGIIIMLAGICLGIYVGLFVLFVGGIKDIVAFFREDLGYMVLTIGILKLMWASFVGSLISWTSVVVGYLFFDKK